MSEIVSHYITVHSGKHVLPREKAEIAALVRAYLGDACAGITEGDSVQTVIVSLHGTGRAIHGSEAKKADLRRDLATRPRYFEVRAYIRPKRYEITTRDADHYTNSVARGFAEALSYRWGATVEEGQV